MPMHVRPFDLPPVHIMQAIDGQGATLPSPPPIFIHSSFRTGSTWLWNKFRAVEQCLSYCEIFNEQLATDSAATLSRINPDSWDSRHPPSAPYFLEFLPLLDQSEGLRLYDVRMAFELFLPAGGFDGELSEGERAYVGALIANARKGGKLPVLTDTRTLGRINALSRSFGGTSIFLYRNLFHQWASYTSQAAKGNTYFIDCLDKSIKDSRHNDFIRHLDDFFQERTSSPEDSQTFAIFVIFHLYLYAHALRSADIVINVNALANDADANREATDRIAAATGIRLDLTDCSENFEFALFECRSKNGLVDVIEQFVKLIGIEIGSPDVMGRVTRIKDEMLVEWQRSEFYARRMRAHFLGKVADLGRTHEQLQDEQRRTQERVAQSQAENGQLQEAHERLVQETERQAASIADLHAQAEHREAELASLHAENNALSQQNEAIMADYRAYKARHRGLRQFWRWPGKRT